MKRRTPALWLLPALALISGCSKGPLDTPISARDYTNYSMWRSDVDPELTDAQRREIVDAESEIKLSIQISSGGGGSDTIEAAFLEAVNGRTLREFLEQGLNSRIDRLKLESGNLAKVLDLDAGISTKEGDVASADFLRNEVEGKRAALQKDQDEIEDARSRLRELQSPTP
jgi:hypothetical protein